MTGTRQIRWLPRAARRGMFGNPKKDPDARRCRPTRIDVSGTRLTPTHRKRYEIGPVERQPDGAFRPAIYKVPDLRYPYAGTLHSPRCYAHVFRDTKHHRRSRYLPAAE